MIRKCEKFCFLLFCCLFPCFVLWGCSGREVTKTISLSESEKSTGIPGIAIKSIRQYVTDVRSKDMRPIIWEEEASGIIYMLVYGDKGYIYQKIDVDKKKILSEDFVEKQAISNVRVAPGGGYISYEADQENELRLFSAKEKKSVVLRMWKEDEGSFSYVWSGDGMRLFMWQNGDDYEKAPDEGWSVTCFDMKTLESGDAKDRGPEKFEIQMSGRNYAWRSVLPNEDGSKVYVREQYETFSDSKRMEEMESEMLANAVSGDINTSSITEKENLSAQNWLLIPDDLKKKKLTEYSKDPVWPLKYTEAGLYFQSEDETLCIVEDIEENPAPKELLSIAGMVSYICEKGDHIFLTVWNGTGDLQINGVKLENGEPTASQVLYKESYEDADIAITLDDTAVIIQGREYLGEDRYSLKITTLKY